MILFLDIEASGLGPDSYPLEIAWISDTGDTEAHLIVPAPSWPEHWSKQASELHGITREEIRRAGKPHDWIAHRVTEVLREADDVISDAPAWDQGWLDELMVAAGLPRARRLSDLADAMTLALLPLHEALGGRGVPDRDIQQKLQAIVEEARRAEAARNRRRHRAAPDAEGLLWRWRRVSADGERLLAALPAGA